MNPAGRFRVKREIRGKGVVITGESGGGTVWAPSKQD